MVCRIFRNSSAKKEVLFSSIAFMTYILVGCGRSFTSFLFKQLESPESTISITTNDRSWIASLPYLFNPLGCLICGFTMDSYGRKISVLSVFAMFFLSWLIITVAPSVLIIYTGMMLQGLAGGMSFCISTYISEISTTSRRGFLLSLIEPMYACGILMSNSLMYFISWKIVSLTYAIMSVLGLLCSFKICESPVWLFGKGFTEKSIETLEFLRGGDYLLLESEIKDMKLCSENEKVNIRRQSKLKQILAGWKPFTVLSVLYILEQSGGFMLIVSYTLIFVQNLNIPCKDSLVVIVYSACGFVASLLTPFFIQRYKRKTALTISTVGMGICMATVAIYEELFYDKSSKPFSWILPLLLYLYVFSYTLGVLPLSFVLGGEMFPYEVRGVMNGLYGSVGYLYASVASKFFPDFLFIQGIKTVLWTFAGFSFLSCIFSNFFIVETKDKTLFEIQQSFKNAKKIQSRKTRSRRRNGYGSMESMIT